MFAAQKIAQAGHEVIILNRDIKPGGLAEYGIYPTKDKMKIGLRRQFAKVLSLPNVHYAGHVTVGEGSALTIADLRAFAPAAIVFAVGAQGAKQLGLPGSEARGVYSAKDFVYYYNQLPPYPSQDFSTGKRVAVVGMGNVAMDVAHWLLIDDPGHTAEEVIIVARRGPYEAKFDKKEFAYIEANLDRAAFQNELSRIEPLMKAVGQDPAGLAEATFPALAKPDPGPVTPRLTFRFLCSPKAIHADANGRISRITVTENILVDRDGDVAAKATDKTAEVEVDTMVFAIGDVADPALAGRAKPAKAWSASRGMTAKSARPKCSNILKPRPTAAPRCSTAFFTGWKVKACVRSLSRMSNFCNAPKNRKRNSAACHGSSIRTTKPCWRRLKS